MRKILWMTLLAGCGGKAAAPRSAAAPKPEARVALAEVDAEGLGRVHAVSYLIVGADGKLAIGALDTSGDLDVSSLVPTPTETLDGWSAVDDPPIPRPPDPDAGILGQLTAGAWGTAFGGDLTAFGSEYPTTTMPCGTALHLDAARDTPVALLIADGAVDAHALLDTLDQMPRPVALVARGNDPRGRALRLVVDGSANIDQTRTQAVVAIDPGMTAAQLLARLGELAAQDVPEVVLDRGATCTVIDMTGGDAYGDLMGNDEDDSGGDTGGWGTIGTGSGGGGTGTGYGAGGGYVGHTDYRPPLMSIGDVTVTKGTADPELVAEYLGVYYEELDACGAADRTATGTVTVKVSFSAQGTVTKAVASGVTDALDRCVEQAVLAIPFLEGAGDVRFSIPITFAAE